MSEVPRLDYFEIAVLVLAHAKVGAPVDPALLTNQAPVSAAHLAALRRQGEALYRALAETLGINCNEPALLSVARAAVATVDGELQLAVSQERATQLLAALALVLVSDPFWPVQWAEAPPPKLSPPAAARELQRRLQDLRSRVEATLQASLKGPLTTAQLIDLLGVSEPTFMAPMGLSHGLD